METVFFIDRYSNDFYKYQDKRSFKYFWIILIIHNNTHFHIINNIISLKMVFYHNIIIGVKTDNRYGYIIRFNKLMYI